MLLQGKIIKLTTEPWHQLPEKFEILPRIERGKKHVNHGIIEWTGHTINRQHTSGYTIVFLSEKISLHRRVKSKM